MRELSQRLERLLTDIIMPIFFITFFGGVTVAIIVGAAFGAYCLLTK